MRRYVLLLLACQAVASAKAGAPDPNRNRKMNGKIPAAAITMPKSKGRRNVKYRTFLR